MVTGKDHLLRDHPLFSPFAIADFSLRLLHEHKAAQDVQETMPLQDFLPEITRAVAARMLRIPRAASNPMARITSSIERQEVGLGPR